MVIFQQLDVSRSNGEPDVSLTQISSEENGSKTKTAVIKAFKQNRVIDVMPFCVLQE